MKLVTHGCSFTYGEELENSSLSWPNILANKLNVQVLNLAQPGYSNDAMVQDIIRSDLTDALVIVGWTSYLRLQIVDNDSWFTVSPGKVFKKHNDSDLRRQFCNISARLLNESWLYERWLTQVVVLQNYLKHQSVPYKFVNAFDNQQHIQDNKLISQIDTSNFIGWSNEGMVEWVYPCKLGSRGHPLEEGHEKIALKIFNELK